MRTGVDSMKMVQDNYSVFLAEAVSATVSATASSITTWYTLNVEEILVRQPPDKLGQDYAELPPAIQPLVSSLASNNLLVPFSGGQAVIDGVTVRDEPTLGQLRLNKKYIFVLFLQRSVRVAELAAQADGVFELSSDNLSMKSLRPSSPLAQDVQSHFGSRLETVRSYLKSKSQ
jgi:hypothetical protein